MKNVKTQILIMLTIGFIGFGIMFFQLITFVAGIVNNAGVKDVFFNGRVQHGVGELMIFVIFFSILLLGKIWTKERVFSLSDKLKLVMMTGGLLNGLALLNTINEKEPWTNFFRIWCLFLLIFGMFATPIAKCMVGRDIEKRSGNEIKTV